MIHPSYVDLMKVVNKDVEEGETPVINSRYSIVMATAKRPRQIVDGDEPLVKVSRGEKPLSTAVDELNQGEIRILAEDEVEEEYSESFSEVSSDEITDQTDAEGNGDEISVEAEDELVSAADETEADDTEEAAADEVADE